MTSALISTADLAARLGAPGLRIIDSSWHLDGRDAAADFEAARIPGAVRFDLDQISDHSTDLPHMAPKPEAFAAAVGALGVGDTDHIVVYDTQGLFSAARVWWLFRMMGAENVAVLDGGFPKWRAEGRPVEAGAPKPMEAALFAPRARGERMADLDMVRKADVEGVQVLDARSAPRFRGEAPEPRAGLRSGHMPKALNLPFGQLLGPGGTMLPSDQLERRFREHGVDLDHPIITSCGSGVTAAILSLGLHELGRDSRLYDGSWVEWGGRADTPVETG